MLRAMIFGRGAKFPEIKKLGEQLLSQAQEKAPGIMADFTERGKVNTADLPDLSFIDIVPEHSDSAVELLSAAADGAKCVARHALIADGNYSSKQIEKILENGDMVEKIIGAVISCRRQRALESVNYTLRFNNVSLSCITHFTRHRIQSIDLPQLTKTDRQSFIIPPILRDKPELLEKYKNAFYKTDSEYKRLREAGISEELLVYYQLSGNTLDIVTTMNARQLLLFMKLRSCNRAQWEIREYAVEALSLLRKAEPKLFRYYGPSCYVGTCPEGRLSCGKAAEVKEKFKNI